MGIFEYNDYKLFVRNRIREMARAGRGQYQKMALHLRVHPTLVSQIFRGVRDLTPEQASEVAVFLELNSKKLACLPDDGEAAVLAVASGTMNRDQLMDWIEGKVMDV